jgi:N-acyl-D-amino-acid deacylase
VHDLVVRAGTVVDGTGIAPVTADVAVVGGVVAEVGRVAERGRHEIDADGLLVAPGFVDIHTHFDGQATWDPILAPSSWHGVTSVAMGNCGVGFAPAKPDRHDWLIGMMEGVEDIPGTALAEGLTWEWESFPEYLDALERVPRSLDVAAHVPHAALRAFVMGERGGDPATHPSDDELASMVALLREALAAGAVGLGSSRTEFHRTSAGKNLGTFQAGRAELVALAEALRGTQAVLQVISDAYCSSDPEFVRSELDLLEAMATAAGRPLSLSVQQPEWVPHRWQELQEWAATCAARGLDIWTQVAPRPIGILVGLTASVSPFSICPTYRSEAQLGLAERVARLRRPEVRVAIIGEYVDAFEGGSVPAMSRTLFGGYDRMFRLEDPVDYDLRPEKALGTAAMTYEQGAAMMYDALLEDDGKRLLYVPMFNYASRNLDAVSGMLGSDRALFGLSDAGAHCRAISDGSFTTSFLTLWARDRAELPIEDVVRRITSATARHVGWHDRGVLRPGAVADINVIDLDTLGCAPPRVVADLPAGGSRLIQKAYGYEHTIKAGVETFTRGEHTGAFPGGLVRGARRTAAR